MYTQKTQYCKKKSNQIEIIHVNIPISPGRNPSSFLRANLYSTSVYVLSNETQLHLDYKYFGRDEISK